MPPFASVGVSARSGDPTKLPLRSTSIKRGSTWPASVQCSQDEFWQVVTGLMHLGHCSAATTILPPVLPPEELLPPPPPHAAATNERARRSTRSGVLRRTCCTFSEPPCPVSETPSASSYLIRMARITVVKAKMMAVATVILSRLRST